jgi:hypothetical protein
MADSAACITGTPIAPTKVSFPRFFEDSVVISIRPDAFMSCFFNYKVVLPLCGFGRAKGRRWVKIKISPAIARKSE